MFKFSMGLLLHKRIRTDLLGCLSDLNYSVMISWSYNTHFEITGGLSYLIGSNWCDLFMNRTIFCFKSHLFPRTKLSRSHPKKSQSCRKKGHLGDFNGMVLTNVNFKNLTEQLGFLSYLFLNPQFTYMIFIYPQSLICFFVLQSRISAAKIWEKFLSFYGLYMKVWI